MRLLRPCYWRDIETPTGYITPIGFVSKETVAFFVRPWFEVKAEPGPEPDTTTLSVVARRTSGG